MNWLLMLGSIVVAGVAFYSRLRTRPARAHLVEPPHTPPIVPWRPPPRGRETGAAQRPEER